MFHSWFGEAHFRIGQRTLLLAVVSINQKTLYWPEKMLEKLKIKRDGMFD